jgi:hypothetical protein
MKLIRISRTVNLLIAISIHSIISLVVAGVEEIMVVHSLVNKTH